MTTIMKCLFQEVQDNQQILLTIIICVAPPTHTLLENAPLLLTKVYRVVSDSSENSNTTHQYHPISNHNINTTRYTVT